MFDLHALNFSVVVAMSLRDCFVLKRRGMGGNFCGSVKNSTDLLL